MCDRECCDGLPCACDGRGRRRARDCGCPHREEETVEDRRQRDNEFDDRVLASMWRLQRTRKWRG